MSPTNAAVMAIKMLTNDIAKPPLKPSMPRKPGAKIIMVKISAVINDAMEAFLFELETKLILF
jgi:hypothetical protein